MQAIGDLEIQNNVQVFEELKFNIQRSLVLAPAGSSLHTGGLPGPS